MNWVPFIFITLALAFVCGVGCLLVFLAKQDQRIRRLRRAREEDDPLRDRLERLRREHERRFGSDAEAVRQDWARVNEDFSRVFQDMTRVGTRIGFTPEEIATAEQNLRAAGISVETLRDHTTTVTRFTKSSPSAAGVQIKTVKKDSPPPPSWQQRLMDDDE